ncbi:glycosyltransferase [Cohnella sp. GCM10020058]|uniref:glycosyltransferase n=1 Tax=Cohnella sp. GCM10020058 TaxID=3317330 RepID=UPI00363FAE62
MKRKVVLHVTGGMNRGGAESLIMNLFRKIDREKINFHFLSLADKKADYDDEILALGGEIFYITPMRFRHPWSFFLSLLSFFSKKKRYYDAIHVHTLFNIGIVLLLSRIAKIPLKIAHSHSTRDTLKDSIVRIYYQKIMRFLIFKNSTILLACSKEAGVYLFGEKNARKAKVVPNAINIGDYSTRNIEMIYKLKKELNINENYTIIGQVGNIKPVKNHLFSLKVAEKLLETGMNFRMLFIGGITENKKESLELNISELGLSKYVTILGLREDIPQLLNTLDIFIMPSIYEGLPVALIEAQAAKLPCIVSNTITTESDIGLNLVNFIGINKEKDIDKWVDKILQLSKMTVDINDRQLERIFSESGFDMAKSISIYMNLYMHGK